MSVDRVLAAAAAHGLASEHVLPAEPLAPDPWRTLVATAEKDRLVDHLASAAASGHLALTDAQHRELAQREERWQAHALAMERLLLRVADHLESDGVELRVIKGPALAHTVYPEPALRTFGDVDIVVPAAQLGPARRSLVHHLGGDDPLPELRPGFDAEFGKDVLVRVGSAEIDVHRTLAAGPFGLRVPVAELMDDPVAFELGGRRLQTLGPAATYLQTCYNAALGDVPPRLASLRDVAQLDLVTRPDPAAVADLTSRWGAAAVVHHAVGCAWSTLGLGPTELSRWAASLTVTDRDRRLLAASTSAGRSYTRQLAALATIPGVGAKGRYLRAIVSPSPEYLAARGWSTGGHLRRAARVLRTARRRPA